MNLEQFIVLSLCSLFIPFVNEMALLTGFQTSSYNLQVLCAIWFQSHMLCNYTVWYSQWCCKSSFWSCSYHSSLFVLLNSWKRDLVTNLKRQIKQPTLFLFSCPCLCLTAAVAIRLINNMVFLISFFLLERRTIGSVNNVSKIP